MQHGAGKSGSKLTPKIKDWYIRELADLRSLVVVCNERARIAIDILSLEVSGVLKTHEDD